MGGQVCSMKRGQNDVSVFTDELQKKIDATMQENYNICFLLLTDQFGVAFGIVQYMVIEDLGCQNILQYCTLAAQAQSISMLIHL